MDDASPRQCAFCSVAAAVLLIAARSSLLLAWLFFLLASYAWWGNPDTLLAPLWKPAAWCLGGYAAARLGHGLILRKLARQRKVARRESRVLAPDDLPQDAPVVTDPRHA